MNRTIKMLLGATNENELVFAEVQMGRYFSVCFDVVYPVEITEEFLATRAEGYLECMDKADLYDMCERYDSTPKDLIHNFIYDLAVEDIIDNSLYTEIFTTKDMNNEIYFESSSCGQCGQYLDDITINRHSMAVIDSIKTWWNLHHLKGLDEAQVTEYMDWLEDLENDREEELNWIENWLRNTVNM